MVSPTTASHRLKEENRISSSHRPVALLGIAQRQIHIKFKQKDGRKDKHNPLPINIKAIGDWIKVNRAAKNLTSGHVAAKMGIAQTLVRSWEDGKSQPDSLQTAVLEKIFNGD